MFCSFVRLNASFSPAASAPDQLLSEVMRAAPDETATKYCLNTAHKVKGREWDRVRLTEDFKVEGAEPEKLALDEALRLFYVAATRAKHHLGVPVKYIKALSEVDAQTVVEATA